MCLTSANVALPDIHRGSLLYKSPLLSSLNPIKKKHGTNSYINSSSPFSPLPPINTPLLPLPPLLNSTAPSSTATPFITEWTDIFGHHTLEASNVNHSGVLFLWTGLAIPGGLTSQMVWKAQLTYVSFVFWVSTTRSNQENNYFEK